MKYLQRRHNARFLIIAAVTCFTGMSASIKAVSAHIPLYESVFVRSAITAWILGALMHHRRIPFKAQNFPLLFTRALSGFLAMSCNFYVLGKLSFGDASMLVNTFPIFVAVLSVIFLGERPSRTLIAWILVAMTGIALILRPQFNFFNYAGFIALLAAVFSSIVVIVIRQSHETDPSLRIAFYFTAIAAFISAPLMLQQMVVPTTQECLLLGIAGLSGTGGQILMTRAYGLEDVSKLSPLSYFGVVLAFLLGVSFWGEIPTAWSIAGTAIVMAACIQIARLEKPEPVME